MKRFMSLALALMMACASWACLSDNAAACQNGGAKGLLSKARCIRLFDGCKLKSRIFRGVKSRGKGTKTFVPSPVQNGDKSPVQGPGGTVPDDDVVPLAPIH